MAIKYKIGVIPAPQQVIALYQNAGLPRPADPDRIAKMYAHSNLVVSAWDNDKLVGIARGLTDKCWCCYLADLAVNHSYQGQAIGSQLVEHSRREIGDAVMLVLLSVPAAVNYYPKLGFKKFEDCFIFTRAH